MPSRKPRQIRERYLNYLDPNIKQGKWTEEEDNKLNSFLSLNSKKSWRNIMKYFPGRTDVSLKNRTVTLNFRKSLAQNSNIESNQKLEQEEVSKETSEESAKENSIEELFDEQFLDENLFKVDFFLSFDFKPTKEKQENSFLGFD
jgi:hypothetical protein